MRFFQYMLVPVLVSVLCFPAAGKVYAGAVLADLENALMCQCDDKCGKVLINCSCDTSDETRKDIVKLLESGLNFEQVVKVYVDEYGEMVLSSPTKTGFNLAAWITPFAALAVGGFGIRKVLKSWIRKKDDAQPIPQNDDESAPSDKSKFASQLKDDLDNMDS